MLFNNNAKSIISLYKITSLKSVRQLSLSAVTRVKELVMVKEGKILKISAIVKPQDDKYLMKKKNTHACPLCSYGLEVKHTDVLIIDQFLDNKGRLRPRNITGLCHTQHKRMDYLAEMAKAAGLLYKSYRRDPKYIKNGKLQVQKWKDFNTYFDEDTIKYTYH